MKATNSANDPNGRRIVDFPKGLDYQYARGRVLYRLGEPRPRAPYDRDGQEVEGITEEEFFLFTGWVCGLVEHDKKRKQVKNALRPDPDDFDPRPPKAMSA